MTSRAESQMQIRHDTVSWLRRSQVRTKPTVSDPGMTLTGFVA